MVRLLSTVSPGGDICFEAEITCVSKILTLDPSISVQAPGQGYRALTNFSISCADLFQSIRPSSRASLLAYEAPERGCFIASRAPVSMPLSVVFIISAPRLDSN